MAFAAIVTSLLNPAVPATENLPPKPTGVAADVVLIPPVPATLTTPVPETFKLLLAPIVIAPDPKGPVVVIPPEPAVILPVPL